MIRKYWTKGFRNLEETVISLEDAKNVFLHGENNQGKTNFLEGLYLLGNGNSPITDSLENCIASDEKEAVLGLEFLGKDGAHKIYIQIDAEGKKRIQLDETVIKSITSIQKLLNVAFLSADVIRVFQENADFRRKELDRFTGIMYPDFLTQKKRYDRILKQKNAALKVGIKDAERLIWNKQLVEHGIRLVKYRKQALAILELRLKELLDHIKPEFSPSLRLIYQYFRLDEHYTSEEAYKADLLDKLNDDAFKESQTGYTLVGPHRDDFKIEIQLKSLFTHFSRGINRMVAILLKLAQMIELDKEVNNFPVLLLDDTFAELDQLNKQKLVTLLETYTTLFYSSVLEEDEPLFSSVRKFSVNQGSLDG